MAEILLLDAKQTLHFHEIYLVFVTVAHRPFYQNNHAIQIRRIAQTVENGAVARFKDAEFLAMKTVATLPGLCLTRCTTIVG